MPPELTMGRGPVSDSTDGAAFRRRYKRAKYDFTRFSSALPRSRRSLRMTKSKPARENSSPARERIEADEPARVLFEPLEPRYLLSADISPLVIAMADAGHDLTLHHDSASDALQVINDQTGQVVGEQQASKTSQLQIIGTNENDKLTIDLTAGFALPLGIKFDAGGGQDQLVLHGSVEEVTHGIGSDGSGQMSFASGNSAGNLSYGGVEAITDAVVAQTRSITVAGIGNDVTLAHGADGGTQLATVKGEAIGFGSGGKSLSIDVEASLKSQAYLQADHIALHGHQLSIGGALDAHGNIGGVVDLTGSLIDLLDGALIDAHGLAGGGSVHVGGDLHGAGALPNATATLVEHGAVIDVSATQSGQGGQAVVWADGATWFGGTILGSGITGGGFAEVSGKQALGFYGTVNLAGGTGAVGTLLLDPNTADITNAAADSGADDGSLPNSIAIGPFTISAGKIEALSATSDISITASDGITIEDLTGGFANNVLAIAGGHSLTFNTDGTFHFANSANEITSAGGTISIKAGSIVGTLGILDVGSGTVMIVSTGNNQDVELNSITAG